MDILPPPKMKNKRLTMKELLQLQKKKRGKTEILHLQKKKRGFTMAELSPPQVMRKKIKNKIIEARTSPPKQARTSPPKQARTNRKFTIDDIPSPPKQPRNSPPKQPRNSPRRHIRLTNRKFTIDDVASPPEQPRNSPPKQSSNSSLSSPNISESISPTPCCGCQRIMKKGDKTPEDCNWCKLKHHLHMCVTNNAKERRKTEKQEMKTLMQKMKRHAI